MKPSLAIAPEPSYRAGHHAAPMAGTGYGEDGRAVLVDDPREEQAEECGTAADAIARLIAMLATGHVHNDGMKLNLLAYLLGATEWKTQRELATALNVSPGRISQIIGALPSEFRAVQRRR